MQRFFFNRAAWVYTRFFILLVIFPVIFLGLTSCSMNNARNHYVLAEKLWNEKNYSASVAEFEKVAAKDPFGKLGLQSLFRAGVTQSLFLSEYPAAVQKFRLFVQRSKDPKSVWEAQLQVGDLLYSKMDHYDLAKEHYVVLLQERPGATEAPEFYFRIAKSSYSLFQFEEAITTYRTLIQKYPAAPQAEKAQLEIGNNYLTLGEQESSHRPTAQKRYQSAIEAFQEFLRHYPQSPLFPQAKFGLASCLEELDRTDEALAIYFDLRKNYPSFQVVEVKLNRIQERTNKKNGNPKASK